MQLFIMVMIKWYQEVEVEKVGQFDYLKQFQNI